MKCKICLHFKKEVDGTIHCRERDKVKRNLVNCAWYKYKGQPKIDMLAWIDKEEQ